MRSNSRLKVRASAVRSSSMRLNGIRRLQSPSMSRRAVRRIESIRPRNCALSHRPPTVPSASVAATAQAKAASTPDRIASGRRRSSPTSRTDPSASGVASERMTSGLVSVGSSPSASCASVQPPAPTPPAGTRRSPAIRLAVRPDETVGEAGAARAARLDDRGQSFAAPVREHALLRASVSSTMRSSKSAEDLAPHGDVDEAPRAPAPRR